MRMRSTALLLGLLALLLAAPAQAQEAPPELATYEGWLREALVAAQREDRLGLEPVAERLIATSEVRAADGERLPVDNSWLDEALATDDPDFEQIAARLGALIDALAPPPSSAPDDAQQRLDNLLSRPPFVSSDSSGGNLFTDFLDWLIDILDRLISPVASEGSGVGAVVRWLIIAACVVLLLGVLIYLALHVRQAATRQARADDPDDPEAHLTATSALQQAGTLAQGGDYRTAVRYLYLSSLLWLDERGMLRYDRALTNREYLARLTDRPDLRARLLPIVETFDQVWYGHASLDAERFRAYQQQVEDLRRLER
jgi:hypothetical protein